MQLTRFSLILTVLLGTALSGGTRSAPAATPMHGGGHRPGAPARLSLLPAGLAQAIEQTLGPATAKPGSYAQQQELTAPDGAPSDDFGYSVALSNDRHTALIGAIGKNGYRGAAYVFMENH